MRRGRDRVRRREAPAPPPSQRRWPSPRPRRSSCTSLQSARDTRRARVWLGVEPSEMIRAEAFDVSSTRSCVDRYRGCPRRDHAGTPSRSRGSSRVKSARAAPSVAQLCSVDLGVPIPNQAIDPPPWVETLSASPPRWLRPAGRLRVRAQSCPPSRALAAPGYARCGYNSAAALADLGELRRDVRPSAPYRATGATGHRLRPGVGGQPRSVVRLSVMGRAIGAADSQPQAANIGRCGPRVRGPGLQVVCLATARDVPFVRRTAIARPSARRAAGRGW